MLIPQTKTMGPHALNTVCPLPTQHYTTATSAAANAPAARIHVHSGTPAGLSGAVGGQFQQTNNGTNTTSLGGKPLLIATPPQRRAGRKFLEPAPVVKLTDLWASFSADVC